MLFSLFVIVEYGHVFLMCVVQFHAQSVSLTLCPYLRTYQTYLKWKDTH